LETQQKQLVDTEMQLKGAVQEAKQSTVMDLELADYQRTIESLEQRICDKDAEIATCKEETAQRDRLIETMKRDTRKLPLLHKSLQFDNSLKTVQPRTVLK
jgi:predicted RNase H-like nuclease (RuvC/YqgF family)